MPIIYRIDDCFIKRRLAMGLGVFFYVINKNYKSLITTAIKQ